jgi:hypothetical protein
MLENAAVFISGKRRFRGVNVQFTDQDVVLYNRVNKNEMARYSIVEPAKDGMAYDIIDDATGSLARLVAQQGCGCSGMKPYTNDSTYTGPLTR